MKVLAIYASTASTEGFVVATDKGLFTVEEKNPLIHDVKALIPSLVENGSIEVSDDFFETKDLVPEFYRQFEELKSDIKFIKEKLGITAVVGEDRLPKVNTIASHIKASVESGNVEGMANLLKRLTACNTDKNFDVQSAMDFLANSELPITDSGDIIFFKKLVTKEGLPEELTVVDCHSQTVPQGYMTKVVMDKEHVNVDRTKSCAQGFHVASFSYAKSFGGNAIGIGIIKPENIIAVPQDCHTKVRVSEYLIHNVFYGKSVDNFNNAKSIKDLPVGMNQLINKISGLDNFYDEAEVLVKHNPNNKKDNVVTSLKKGIVLDTSTEKVNINAVELDPTLPDLVVSKDETAIISIPELLKVKVEISFKK